MASSYEKKLTPEQVRASYREQFFVADLLFPILVDRLDVQGLVHSGKLNAALRIDIPLWDERPPLGRVNVLTMEWMPSSSNEYLAVVASEDIPDASVLPDADFPLSRSIPLAIFSSYEGLFKFRYRVSNWNGGGERVSPSINVIIDRTGPKWVAPEHAMISITEPVITDAVLTSDGGVKCVIPEFTEANSRAEVMVAVAWLDRMPAEGEDIDKFIVLFQPLPPSREVLVPASAVTNYGSKTQYAIALLIDKAGNRGELSLPATVQVALGTLPSALKPCTVPLADGDGLVDRADAAFPTKVHIESYTGYSESDGILVMWGTKTLTRTSVGAHLPFPLKITVPWPHMMQEYDFTSSTHVQSVDVNYEVLRGDYPFAPPSGIMVDTDFSIPKPGNPDPEPIDPTLNLINFLSSTGSSTELTLADIGAVAKASVELFDDPNLGDTLTLYYNGVVVDSPENPYVVTGTETPNEVIDFNIPWDVIKLTPVMDDLPLYYSLTHADFANPLESNRTTINVHVEIIDLPEPEFPVGGVINCNSLEEKGGVWGIYMHIPTSTYLKEGTAVEAEWQSFDNTDKEITGTDHAETLTVSADEETNGINWFVPYDKCLKPTYPGPYGVGKTKYTIVVRGTPESSLLVDSIIAVFEGDGSGNIHCKIPRP